jgi:hypothetical protein
MKMQSPTILINRIRTQLLHTGVALPRTRLILYSLTLLTSLISAFFFIVALIHHTRTVSKDPTYRLNYERSFNSLMSVILIPLFWSAVWSFIVLRSLLKAIDHSLSSAAATSVAPMDTEALATPTHPAEPPKHQSRGRRCCCCTCGHWISPSRGPHPVLALLIELFLWPCLVVFGFWFAILFSSVPFVQLSYEYTMSCKVYLGRYDTRLNYTCTTAFGEVVGLEATALVGLALNILTHIALFIIAFVLVHRWRGETGRRRSGRGKGRGERRKRGKTGGIDEVGEGGWIEMGRGKDGQQ